MPARDSTIDTTTSVDYPSASMGLMSWLFPSDADNLARARALMKDGQHEKARKVLLHCALPEAEALYEECSAAVDKANLATTKKRLAAEGFHGWKVEVSARSARRKKELEDLVADEMAKAGVDLGLPDIDEAKIKAILAKAQRRAVRGGSTEVGAVRIVPIIDPARLPR